MSQDSTPEILAMFEYPTILMLIPKKRGEGYLRVPLGHHACPLHSLSYDLRVDICGLDGMLEVELGRRYTFNDLDGMVRDYVVPIAKLLGFPFRVVEHAEFWENHPITGSVQTKIPPKPARSPEDTSEEKEQNVS
jgi:hypothetical protein